MLSSRTARSAALVSLMGALGLLAVGTTPADRYSQLFWPSGVAVAAVFVAGRPVRRPVLVAIAVMAFATFVLGGLPILISMGLTAGILAETWVVTEVVWRGGRPDRTVALRSGAELIRFLVAASLGALTSGAVAGVLVVLDGTARGAVGSVATFASHLASQLLIVPLVARVDHHGALARPAERVLQWVMTLSATAILLLPVGLSLIALAVIPLLGWGAMRLSVRESLAQTILVSTVVTGTTASGRGSFARLPDVLGLPEQLQNVVAAGFAVNCVFVVLPLALAVAEQVGSARLAATERDKLENIVDSATGVAIIGVDHRGRMTVFNPGAERALGYTAAEVLGRSTRMFHSEEAIAAKAVELGVEADFEVVARALARPEHARTDMGFRRKDGVERVHSMTLTPLQGEDGRELGFVSTSEDITERVRAAALLQEALDAEREAVERLQEVDEVKDAFVSMVSHELRTPITSILGYVEMLADGTYGGLSADQAAAIDRVASNSSRLLILIDDLLTLSRVQQNGIGLSTRPFDLRSVVAAGHDLVSPTWRHRDLQVSLHLPPEPVSFLGDKDMLERVVVNLVGNAVKFTPDGGTVAVDLGMDGQDAVLQVRDSGIGIPEAEQSRLFQRFFRASTAEEQHIRGTGLGLSITKAIVEQHHGSVHVESQAAEGSTFEVRMPVGV